MDFERLNKASNFGRGNALLIVDGMSQAGDTVAATLWEQNGQRSCAVSVPWESVSVAPETHCAVAEPAGFTGRCDRSETGAVWLQSSQIVASTTGAATTIAKSNIMRNDLDCIVKHITGIIFARQEKNRNGRGRKELFFVSR